MTLTGMDFAVLGTMFAATTAVPFTIILVIVKFQTRRIELLEAVLSKKVEKVDWLRESVATREKIDHMAIAVAKVSGAVEATFSAAQSMNRACASMEKIAKGIGQ